MTEKLEPGYYRGSDGTMYRWRTLEDGLCRHEYLWWVFSSPKFWAATSRLSAADAQTSFDALKALIASEDENLDWVQLTPYLRCLRDGTRPQERSPISGAECMEWKDYRGGRDSAVREAYRMGLAAGREER